MAKEVGLQKYKGIAGPKPDSKTPKAILVIIMPLKLKVVDCKNRVNISYREK
jgi:hypothetical protein